MSIAIVAFGAVSAMGRGDAAVSAGRVGEAAQLTVREDEELAAAGLARPFAARASSGRASSGDRATSLLSQAAGDCATELDRVLPSWRALRVGLCIGTSSGGMRTAAQLWRGIRADASDEALRPLARGALYGSALRSVVEVLDRELRPASLVMGACAASTLAIGIAGRWLESDACDLVLAGGFDAVGVFVAAGFEALRATSTKAPPRPFRAGRDGMALGEGAAVLALQKSHVATGARVHVTGFGASCDAVHLTAPDRTGAGLARAASAALAQAGFPKVDFVSPHGSATPFSDAAEARALERALGAPLTDVVVHPFKAQIGHTLGASGALETLAAADALTRGVLPAAAGAGEVDPEAPVRLLSVTEAGTPRNTLKLSAAFGGANAALVLSLAPHPAPRRLRPVYLRRGVVATELPGTIELASLIGWPPDRVARADVLTRWVLAAVGSLVARDGAMPKGTGIVVGSTFATFETNASFFARIEERGARMAEPRKFPYTSPNAAAGDAGVAFGLTGPGFCVGAGEHGAVEALVVASQLVASGDADTIVVVGVEDVGPAVTRLAGLLDIEAEAGAVAVVVTSAPETAFARVASAHAAIAPARLHTRGAFLPGPRALAPLAGASVPLTIESSGLLGWARVTLDAPEN